MFSVSACKVVRSVGLKPFGVGARRSKSGVSTKLLFRQLFEKESSTYTYLLADSSSNDAILIDPVLETCGRYACCITFLLV